MRQTPPLLVSASGHASAIPPKPENARTVEALLWLVVVLVLLAVVIGDDGSVGIVVGVGGTVAVVVVVVAVAG